VTALTAPPSRSVNFAFALSTQTVGANMTDKKDMASEGVKDQLKGTAKGIEGRVRSTVGAATGDTGEQLKGKGQEIKGKAQREFGKAKQDLDPNPGVDEE
jgi:uncharacterized protein YjbJ (UPF0337 family)